MYTYSYCTLTVAEKDQLQDVRVVNRHASASHLPIGILEIRMLNWNCVCQIKWTIYGTAVSIHWLQIQLSSWWHQNQAVVTVIKDETDISDLATGKQEIVERTQCILREVVNLLKRITSVVENRCLCQIVERKIYYKTKEDFNGIK